MPRVLQSDIVKNQEYMALNPGKAVGRIHIIDKLDDTVQAENLSDWTRLHMRVSRQYRPENPELPTLDPWRNSTTPPSDQFEFVRNPFYHRVDTEGRQLPYADSVVLTMGSTDLIPAKAGAGDTDLQARYIRFDNYTFLKNAEERIGIKVHLWKAGNGSAVALLPNLNAKDPVWRELLRDVRFRRAMSLAIDRTELNQVVYFGLANESADTMLPESPLYREEYQKAWAAHDPDAANALLDELGLEVGPDGIRRLPDGRLPLANAHRVSRAALFEMGFLCRPDREQIAVKTRSRGKGGSKYGVLDRRGDLGARPAAHDGPRARSVRDHAA